MPQLQPLVALKPVLRMVKNGGVNADAPGRDHGGMARREEEKTVKVAPMSTNEKEVRHLRRGRGRVSCGVPSPRLGFSDRTTFAARAVMQFMAH